MALQDYQYQLGALVMGPGTPYRIKNVRGLFDLDVDSGAVPIPRGDGSIEGDDWVSAKNIEIEIAVHGPKRTQEHAELVEALQFEAQRARESKLLVFKEPGLSERQIRVRPIGRAVTLDVTSEFGMRPVLVRLHAADPRIYSNVLQSILMQALVAGSAGTDMPMNFASNFEVNQTETTILHNAGIARAYPLIRFFGPGAGTVDAVAIVNETNGSRIDITTAILTGQTLRADMEAYVTANGNQVIGLDGSSRYGDWELPREPFWLAPGDNIVRYEVTGTSDDSVVRVNWRDTWL